jgi:hypothetical protein
MPFLLLIYLLSSGASLSTRQETNHIPSSNPERIEGPWEATSVSGIDGVFLTTVGGSGWQTLDVRVYHRYAGVETWGYFGTDDKATQESYNLQGDHSFTLFDGSRLRIHFVGVADLKPFDLDVAFSASSREWSGTWRRADQCSNVVLKRPEPRIGAIPNVFVGDWTSVSTKDDLAPGSLHLRQSTDGKFSAWLDREIASSDRRNGEFLQVLGVSKLELDVERPGEVGRRTVTAEVCRAISKDSLATGLELAEVT